MASSKQKNHPQPCLESFTKIAQQLIKWGGLSLTFYIFSDKALPQIAGKSTSFNASLSLPGGVITIAPSAWISGTAILAMAAIIGVLVWHHRQVDRLHRDNNEKCHKRVKELEHRFDTKRSTSKKDQKG